MFKIKNGEYNNKHIIRFQKRIRLIKITRIKAMHSCACLDSSVKHNRKLTHAPVNTLDYCTEEEILRLIDAKDSKLSSDGGWGGKHSLEKLKPQDEN